MPGMRIPSRVVLSSGEEDPRRSSTAELMVCSGHRSLFVKASWAAKVGLARRTSCSCCSSIRASRLIKSTHACASSRDLTWKWKFFAGEKRPKTFSRRPLGSLRKATAVNSDRVICLWRRDSDSSL